MLFRLLRRIPIAGGVLWILNTYAFKGDAASTQRFADPVMWIKAYGIQAAVALVGAALCMPAQMTRVERIGSWFTYEIDVKPGPLATGILPNVLGFGIGVYALIFVVRGGLLRKIQETMKCQHTAGRRRHGSVLLLNAEVAVPLLVLCVALFMGVMQLLLATNVVVTAFSWFFFWLSLVFTLDLVITLFGLGENVILESLGQADREGK